MFKRASNFKENHRIDSCSVSSLTYAAFRLTCRLPHCCFDDGICTTVHAPLAAEG